MYTLASVPSGLRISTLYQMRPSPEVVSVTGNTVFSASWNQYPASLAGFLRTKTPSAVVLP